MKQNLFVFFCAAFAVFAAGCGKKDDAQQTVVQSYYSIGTQGQSGLSAPQILGQYPYFYVNYRVDEANCDTGWRRFSGNDPRYVKTLMCDSFHNDSMNQNCGRAQREAWFQAVCQGY